MKPIWSRCIIAALCLAVAAALTTGPTSSREGLGLPSRAMVTDLERKVRLPKGAKPLSAYARYYSLDHASGSMLGLQVKKGDVVVTGYYLAIDPKEYPPGIHLVTPSMMPIVFDGGCSAVTVFYDIKTTQISRAVCNGEA